MSFMRGRGRRRRAIITASVHRQPFGSISRCIDMSTDARTAAVRSSISRSWARTRAWTWMGLRGRLRWRLTTTAGTPIGPRMVRRIIAAATTIAVLHFLFLLLVPRRTVRYQVIHRFAVMATLGLRPHSALGSYVIGKFSTIVTPYFPKAFFGKRPSMTSSAVNPSYTSNNSGFQAFIGCFALKFHFFFVTQTPKSGHLNHWLVNKDILTAIVWSDEPPTFCNVEPFAPSSSPATSPWRPWGHAALAILWWRFQEK